MGLSFGLRRRRQKEVTGATTLQMRKRPPLGRFFFAGRVMGYRSASQPTGIRSEPRTRRNFIRFDAPLETLPVFFDLEGRRVIVVGGSEGAAWKADLAAATGARVEVFAADPCDEDARNRAGARQCCATFPRDPREEELKGAALIFGASPTTPRRARARGRRRGGRPDQSCRPPGIRAISSWEPSSTARRS